MQPIADCQLFPGSWPSEVSEGSPDSGRGGAQWPSIPRDADLLGSGTQLPRDKCSLFELLGVNSKCPGKH